MESTGFEGGFAGLQLIFTSIYSLLGEITIMNNSLISILGIGFIIITTFNLIFDKAWGGD